MSQLGYRSRQQRRIPVLDDNLVRACTADSKRKLYMIVHRYLVLNTSTVRYVNAAVSLFSSKEGTKANVMNAADVLMWF